MSAPPYDAPAPPPAPDPPPAPEATGLLDVAARALEALAKKASDAATRWLEPEPEPQSDEVREYDAAWDPIDEDEAALLKRFAELERRDAGRRQ